MTQPDLDPFPAAANGPSVSIPASDLPGITRSAAWSEYWTGRVIAMWLVIALLYGPGLALVFQIWWFGVGVVVLVAIFAAINSVSTARRQSRSMTGHLTPLHGTDVRFALAFGESTVDLSVADRAYQRSTYDSIAYVRVRPTFSVLHYRYGVYTPLPPSLVDDAAIAVLRARDVEIR